MSLRYKPDWEQAKQRYRMWWAGENFGRCGLSVTARRNQAIQKPPDLPARVADRWLDLDYLSALNHYRMSQTYYGGEAVPVWYAGYPGWDFIAVFLGCPIELKEETGWVYPLIQTEKLDDYPISSLQIDPNNRWWRFGQLIHRLAAQEAAGCSIPGIQAIGGVGDILAGLRGTDRLLLDVSDCPDVVRNYELHLIKVWQEVFDSFYEIISGVGEGCSNFFHMWAPGKFYITSNDFSYMISSKMYEDLFLPALEMQLKHLDFTLYHVDGIEAFRHVDLLCSLPGLDGLQILPGAGKPSPLHYMDVLKKVQAAGKKLHISIPSTEVKDALEQLSSRGLFIATTCDSEEEANELLRQAERWSHFD